VVGQVGGGLGEVHGGDGVAGGDALVEGGEHAKAQLAGQGRLADEDAGEGALGVHVGVGEQAQLLQLFGGQQVGLVDADDDAAAAFVLFGGEQVGGLAHDFGLVEAGAATQRGDDGDVEASGADGGVGDVDDLVAGAVQLGGGGADVAADDPEGGFGDAEADAGDGFGVGGATHEVAGGDAFGEGGLGEAEVGDPGRRRGRAGGGGVAGGRRDHGGHRGSWSGSLVVGWPAAGVRCSRPGRGSAR